MTASSEEAAYDELQCYTLAHGDPVLIIDAWCASVWGAFHESHQAVVELLKQHRIVA